MAEETVMLEAFKLHSNIYFIGNEEVSVHLIDTERGLVIIDTGFPDMEKLIPENIKKLGFDPRFISDIFHSHGHIDHFGTTESLKKISGAKTYISRIDNEIANGNLDLSWAKEVGLERIKPFSADVLIEDGDVFDFGNTKIRCVLTPGHTDGVISFIITLADGKVAAMHGGLGMNSMKSAFLLEYGLSFECRDKFRQGLEKLQGERVDLVIGNHPEQNDTVGKMIRARRGEEILDPEEWGRLLKSAKKRINALEERDPRT